MKCFPEEIKFKYPWRKYQARVLDELEKHLNDDHLHIVAPPGSGKTVLGLEVMIRLNMPSLILAPTIAIRDQWIHRFCDLFLQVKQEPEWISRNIKTPSFLTVSTYQALHAACARMPSDGESAEDSEEEVDGGVETNNGNGKFGGELVEKLKAQGIGAIIVDEAHHLKNEWWKAVTGIKKSLNPIVVGLTATPPYDVSFAEWQRYIELNGPVDAEISIPELVVEGDLCPHQDFIMFSFPTLEESQRISEYRIKIEEVVNGIKNDVVLIDALENHPIYRQPDQHLDWIYDNLECYSAILIFLNTVGREVNAGHLEVIGDKKFSVPPLTFEWLEILLEFYLYKDPENFEKYEAHQEKLTRKLKRTGVAEKRSINFKHSEKINRYLTTSVGKLESIKRIAEFEYEYMRQDLRMVILTDYIRKEFLTTKTINEMDLNKIGVMPIFEKLRRSDKQGIKFGVLTGTIVIIPASALEVFQRVAGTYGIVQIQVTPLSFDDRFLLVGQNDQLKHQIVHVITQVFQKGHIEVLIGTKSLLGEGWDAPSINALILASFVGSYVLSNQMRGRAIRTERLNTDKTGNIWHLVCVDPASPEGGDDFQLLKRRFKAFVGVSMGREFGIENGINRLNLPELICEEDIRQINGEMILCARRRDQLKEKWMLALKDGITLVEEIKAPFPRGRDYKKIKSLYFKKTIAYASAVLVSAILALSDPIMEVIFNLAKRIMNPEDFLRVLLVAGVILFAVLGPQLFKVCRLYIKYRDISEDIQGIGEALLDALIKAGAVHTKRADLKVVSRIDERGAVYCHLEGGTTYEKSIFIKSLHEVIEPVVNPRYVIIRKSFFVDIVPQKDYHAVPEIIGKRKSYAEFFKERWLSLVGSCELIYTRTIDGRKMLLRSRMHSLASEFQDRAERINKWR